MRMYECHGPMFIKLFALKATLNSKINSINIPSVLVFALSSFVLDPIQTSNCSIRTIVIIIILIMLGYYLNCNKQELSGCAW